MEFEQLLAAYLRDPQVTRSLRLVMIDWWPMFADFCRGQGLTKVGEVAPRHLEAFLQDMQWQPTRRLGRFYAANTVYHVLRHIRKLLRWAAEHGHLPLDPSKELALSTPLQPTPPRLSWQELQAILAAPDRTQFKGLRDATLITLLVETQWPASRCLALNVGDEKRLRLEDSTHSLLTAYLQNARPQWARAPDERALFLTQLGRRMGPQTAFNVLVEAAKVAGVEGPVTIRMLGRSYQAELQSAGGRLPLQP